jgi:hypothetical protein
MFNKNIIFALFFTIGNIVPVKNMDFAFICKQDKT